MCRLYIYFIPRHLLSVWLGDESGNKAPGTAAAFFVPESVSIHDGDTNPSWETAILNSVKFVYGNQRGVPRKVSFV